MFGQQYTKVVSICTNAGWLNFKQTKKIKTKAKPTKWNQTALQRNKTVARDQDKRTNHTNTLKSWHNPY